jgi:hypothetical protein
MLPKATTMKRLCDYEAAISNMDFSSLLGINKLEYENLIHSPLYYYKNEKGIVTEFFMYISPLNHDNILKKVRRNEYNIAVFDPSQVFELNRKQFILSKKVFEHLTNVM